jgi:hypothetical protein
MDPTRLPLTDASRSSRDVPRRIGEFVAAVIGVLLLAGAIVATQRWFDKHFLPSFFLPRRWYVLILTAVRMVMATLGVLLALIVRRRIGRLVARMPVLSVQIVTAGLLALAASELALRHVHLRSAGWLMPEEEPRRQPDPRLGWTFVPARTGHAAVAGRTIDYAFDAAGYRVRRVDEPVDPDRPTLVFIGESVMFGEGLTWEETIPAQVGAAMGIQSANLAVHGYSTDQGYLRLEAELPRFRHPVAVVALFMTALFGRNLDDDRPHLGPRLIWLPAESHGRLKSLATLLVPYRSDETVERGIVMTQQVLRAIADLSSARGATPLIVVPQLGPEEPVEQAVRHRVLDDAQLPYVLIETDDAWRLSWDRHPNASAAQAIAEAIAARLRGR